jgi:hypothetical protein
LRRVLWRRGLIRRRRRHPTGPIHGLLAHSSAATGIAAGSESCVSSMSVVVGWWGERGTYKSVAKTRRTKRIASAANTQRPQLYHEEFR